MSTKYNTLLPDYLAGFLDDSKTKEIENELLSNRELKEELDEIEFSIEKYAHESGIPLKTDLSNDIWDSINNSSQTFEDFVAKESQPKSFQLGGFFSSYIGIAASVLLLASLIGNIYLAQQAKYQKENFISTLNEKNNLQDRIREVKSANELAAQEVALLRNPNMKVCKLVSENPDDPRSLLLAIDMKQEMQVMVMSPDLPRKPSDHSYQLWAVSSDGEMICMGTFDSEKRIYTMKKLPFKPKEFGVTMEKGKLGKPQPTSDFLVRGI